jgi:hypothetical protein
MRLFLAFILTTMPLMAQLRTLPQLPVNSPKQILLQFNRYYIYENGQYTAYKLYPATQNSLLHTLLAEVPETEASLLKIQSAQNDIRKMMKRMRIPFKVLRISSLALAGSNLVSIISDKSVPTVIQKASYIGVFSTLPFVAFSSFKLDKYRFRAEDEQNRAIFLYNRAMQEKALE